jgi:hypothetical protein
LRKGQQMEILTARELQEYEDARKCTLEQQQTLLVGADLRRAQLTCWWFPESGLQERICSYMRRLAEIRREELALRDLWHDLLMRIEVGGTNG